jgi:gluconolactonase
MKEPKPFAEKLPAPEGPVLGPNGWVLNVCAFDPKDPTWPPKGADITATHASVPLQTHTVFNTSVGDTTGIPAALAFGPDGNLYVTDEGRLAIVRVTLEGELRDFITHFEGKRINGPNDLCFDEDGNLFFTDPWGSSLGKPIGAVYGYEWATGTLHQIHHGLAFPNGIIVREGRLLAAETQTNKIWEYDIVGPGRAENPREFCTLPQFEADTIGWTGPDGMKFDHEGNVYVAALGVGAGVIVYDPDGELVEIIPTGGTRTTNLCFGGPELKTLYVTVDDIGKMVTIEADMGGYRLPFCPSVVDDHPWAKMLPDPPTAEVQKYLGEEVRS